MENELQIFNNEIFGNVRAVMISNQVWFVAKDIAKALGYKNTRDVISKHCKGVAKHDILTNGGVQPLNVINEYDVIRLIMKSKLPQAQEFEQWVIEEVIPSVLATGQYQIKQDSYVIEDPIKRAERWIEEEKERQALKLKIEEDKPKVEFAEAIQVSKSNLTMGQFAKQTTLGRNQLFEFLRENKILFYDRGATVPYQQYINQKLFVVTQTVNNKWSHATTRVTPKGQQYLFNRFPELKRKE